MKVTYTLDMDIEMGDTHKDSLQYLFYRMTQHIMGTGQVTGDTSAEIIDYKYNVEFK
jgi:hypothetical protein